ncbi:putative threonine/serine exporter [Septoria linicola]|nr:putative threonine/serine exporter [Septoria linicola]
MEHQRQNSSPSEPDDEPDISNTIGGAERERRARVRFDSNAAARPPTNAHVPSVPSAAVTQDQVSVPIRPHPILRGNSREAVPTQIGNDGSDQVATDRAAAAAQSRGNAMANTVRRESPPGSRGSFESTAQTEDGDSDYELLSHPRGIRLKPIGNNGYSGLGQHSHSLSHDTLVGTSSQDPFATDLESGQSQDSTGEADAQQKQKPELDQIFNGYVDGSYNVPKPENYRGGVLSQLLKLQKQADIGSWRDLSPTMPGPSTPGHPRGGSESSGTNTPGRRKWYDQQNDSRDTLATLIGASKTLATPANPNGDGRTPRPKGKRNGSMANRLSAMFKQEESQVKMHISGILARQEFILKMCRALMLYGAPTHRLEEYLTMTARALEIEAQFLYIPGCMIISFDDATTHTTEVKLVRLAQGIDLGRLKDVHRVYKEVIHDVISVEEATGQLDEFMAKKPKFHPWIRVLVFGLTSVAAAPFSFKARMIDLPLCFFFGCLVGALQLILAPKSPLYSNVFEVSATVLVSFLARAFGSIRGGDLFCFSALAQGGIVMLLPGYMFLSSSLELQARAIVPGSIRIVYGVVYSLLLGFGITIGAVLYGLMDPHATSQLQCSNPMPGTYGFIFVPPFVLCISILYQAKWKQMPIMVIVAFAGYVVNYYSSLRFSSSPQIASTLGAFAVGALANLYSRFRHGVAAAILVPAIFTQVPGGLASTGGLLSGLRVANEITNATTNVDGTSYEALGVGYGASSNELVFNVAGSMIQIAVGITVGLFLSALVVYPLGKRRSGLFSF